MNFCKQIKINQFHNGILKMGANNNEIEKIEDYFDDVIEEKLIFLKKITLGQVLMN